jgi:hypothetical protein
LLFLLLLLYNKQKPSNTEHSDGVMERFRTDKAVSEGFSHEGDAGAGT